MSRFEISRSTHVQADPARLRALIEDFREWTKWSPWEDVDPALQRSYTGPEKGVGAHYEWSGNRKAGQGAMEITAVTPERIEVLLTFVKPWKATNQVAFELVPAAGGTEVTWRMTGEQRGMAALFGKVFPMDKLVGKDFEKGLARLKAVAEHPA
jgi:hypothetical protein